MTDYVEMMKANGWQVYMRKPDAGYCFCTDGTNICYVQWSGWTSPHVASVHKPNRQTGTGFHLMDEITPKTIAEAMQTVAPHWASSKDRESVRKYKNWGEFHQENSFNRELSEVL